MIEVKNLIRTFSDAPGHVVQALAVKEFTLGKGEKTALTGPSGSGKTTFLHCLSALLSPTSGTISVDGKNMDDMTEKEKQTWRAACVGYIFQKALLIPYLTVAENIALAAEMAGKKKEKKEIDTWLGKVGLAGYGGRKPAGLSGGEQQRVSFLRALDKENSRILMDLLLDYHETRACMLLCASHDPAVQERFPHKFPLERGHALCT